MQREGEEEGVGGLHKRKKGVNLERNGFVKRKRKRERERERQGDYRR